MGVSLILTLCFVPIYFPLLSHHEGRLFPVVVPVIDAETERPLPIIAAETPSPADAEPYVDVYVQFNKIRSCRFLRDVREEAGEVPAVGDQYAGLRQALSWYDPTGNRLNLEFEAGYLDNPASRPVGLQVAGPWRIYGVRTAVGTRAVVEHACHPFWLTYTQFYS